MEKRKIGQHIFVWWAPWDHQSVDRQMFSAAGKQNKSGDVYYTAAQDLPNSQQTENPTSPLPHSHFLHVFSCLFTDEGIKQDVTSPGRWIILMWWLCHTSVTKHHDFISSAQRLPGGIELTEKEMLMSVTYFYIVLLFSWSDLCFSDVNSHC